MWERLKAAMRQYRVIAAGQDTGPVEEAIVFYAGWLGHYVGDGSQPLHVAVSYNGWTGPNPNGYTTEPSDSPPVRGAVCRGQHPRARCAGQDDAGQGHRWRHVRRLCRLSAPHRTYVEKVYQLEKAGGFVGAGTPESRDFTAARLADGASMLRDMIYTAWIDSAQPVPEGRPAF